MTNRQSNIIFYGVISIILYGLIVNHFYPDFFDDLSKSKEELTIKEAIANGDPNKALTVYQQLVAEKVNDGSENTVETAAMYEDMASLYSQLGNKAEEKNYYLKSLNVKKKLLKVNTFSFANTYVKLGLLAEEEKQYEQAQAYYEQSLVKRLGDTKAGDNEGMFEGMQNAQQRFKRLNNLETIATFKKLAALHALKKEYVTAKDYYEKALTASKLTSGEDDVKTLEIIDLIKQLPL